MNPMLFFNRWFNEEVSLTKVRIPTACCFTTLGEDGFPNPRFVSLKEVIDNKFVVTGPLNSRKGSEIKNNNKVALTFWWTETERQVRVQGFASRIDDSLSDKYFSERDRNSQIVSIVSEQGQELHSNQILTQKFESMEKEYSDQPLPRPENWGGFFITPLRIEFLEFKSTRFHVRTLYELIEGQWMVKHIQP